MGDYEKLSWCEECQKETTHTFSMSGNKKFCNECNTAYKLEWVYDDDGIFDIPTWEEEKVES